MKVEKIERVFVFSGSGKSIDLSDPNGSMSPEQVLKFYSTQYPLMNNSQVEKGKLEGNKQKYNIVSVVGTKG
jgi:PRTRC genetic system protein C